jgi:Ribbon-helix-helix protein, copG family
MHVYTHLVAKTKRVQVLMDPAEFATLECIAKKRGTSVAELIREAARLHLLDQAAVARRRAAFRRFLELPQIELPPWKELKAEIEARRG